jgi:hypothetical protein
MAVETVVFKEWAFKVDKKVNEQAYASFLNNGSETCICGNCKNYLAYRDQVFPDEIKKLFKDLGIEYNKEVDIVTYQKLPNGLYHTGGWFHFKGLMICGRDSNEPLQQGGYLVKLTVVSDNFSIGFSNNIFGNLNYFEDKDNLIQIDFETNIPWVLNSTLEAE